MNDGFVSVVADRNDSTRLLIRARKKEHLTALLGECTIEVSTGTDYKYRTYVSRDLAARLIADRISSINYDNFKNSVPDNSLHNLYARFWSLHRAYQS